MPTAHPTNTSIRTAVTAWNAFPRLTSCPTLLCFLLMFVIGSLAMAAIATGGQLVLYDLGLKQYSRGVMREVRNLRRA